MKRTRKNHDVDEDDINSTKSKSDNSSKCLKSEATVHIQESFLSCSNNWVEKLPKNTPRFLTKTYQMITECEPTIASWSNDGEVIEIKDISQFESEVMPKYFESVKFSSFTRQLNFYGFHKIQFAISQKKESDNDSKKMLRFCHKLFQRNKPELMADITRSTHSNSADTDNQEQAIENLKESLFKTKQKLSSMANECHLKIDQLENLFDERVERVKKMLEDDSDEEIKNGQEGDDSHDHTDFDLKQNPFE